MRKILDYIRDEQRTFDEFPFNNIDALILAEATYFQWEEIMEDIWTPEWPYKPSDSLFLHDMPASDAMPLFGQFSADSGKNFKMIDSLRSSARYGNVSVSHLCTHTDITEEIQFAAMCFHIPDGTCFIAFRGTDGTLIGWKEDFQLSYRFPVPAQTEAARYVSYLARELAPDIRFYIGGHSKGGNLSIYSATSCVDSIKDRILKVFSFDGPGFAFNHHETEEYKKIASSIFHYVPQASFVGMLLQSAPGTKYIANRSLWLMQHSPFTWEIRDDDFAYVDDLDKNARARIGAVDSWLADMSFDERQSFTEMMYKIATSSGARNIFSPDVSWGTKMSHIVEITKSTDAKSRARIVETLRLLILLSFRQKKEAKKS